ncbi:poly(ADP-ribose) glycohydrolase domain-containing protein [Legionella sp. 227]|uniref:poly(ADP-ribose) glycohydrolase domain-containing protein n=1 Tax=Legionella sp. 227 TaxID=3367288 RepID=UPI00370D87FA
MRAVRELRKPHSPLQYSILKEVHLENKPSLIAGIFSGDRWRHRSMGLTLDQITDQKKFEELQSDASNNLKLWEKDKVDPPQKVEVVHQDFGEATLEVTKKHGKIYPVLNMANSLFPGGAVLEGGSAQEENMWHRSTCARSLLAKGIYYDKAQKCFLYDENSRKLLNAQAQMSPEELESLSIRRGVKTPEAFKVFMDDQPQICFRGKEILVPIVLEEEFTSKRILTTDTKLSYAFLPKDQIFPFYEIRSAAPELIGKKIDFNNKEFLKEYIHDLSRRIGAQLDTLILKGKTNAVLGAWGCGSFRNNPEIVAQIYREEITKRAEHFQHIVFPIIGTEHEANFQIFKKHLDGLELGHLANKSSLKGVAQALLNPYSLYTSRDKKTTPEEETSKTPSP